MLRTLPLPSEDVCHPFEQETKVAANYPSTSREDRQLQTAAQGVQREVQSPDLQRENSRLKMSPVQPYNYNNAKSSKGERRKQEGMEKRNQAVRETKLLTELIFRRPN